MEAAEFKKLLKDQVLIALASSADGTPNVRILDFVFDEETNKLIFPTSNKSAKVGEFAQNATVSFTTVPMGPSPVVRVKGATVAKSAVAVDEILPELISKRPSVEFLVKGMGETCETWEIEIKQAVVIEKGKPDFVTL